MKILVVGYPYVRERYFATFRHWLEAGNLRFILPQRWTAKAGKVVFTPPTDANILTAKAYFHDSHAPLVGGLLKGWMPAFPLSLWRLRHQVDLVYACSEPALLTTLYYAFWTKLLGKKYVCFSWQNLSYPKWPHRFLVRFNLWLSDGLVCGNSTGAKIHRDYTQKPIAVIPMNGLDPEVFKTNPRAGILSDRIVFSFVGALGYRKGIQNILKALPEVLQSVPNAHLIIAGSGEYEHPLDHLISELGLREQVTRLPWVDQPELIRLLATSDVFVYPSLVHGGWAEQFGYSMAEASLMELPVISTRSGSIPDVVQNDRTGLLVPPDDVLALAQAMIKLGTDGGLRKRLGIAGRQYISQNFSHRAIAQKFYGFFRTLC